MEIYFKNLGLIGDFEKKKPFKALANHRRPYR